MPKLIQIQQNTPDWLSWKRGKIGASQAPTIMGENPWATRLQLFNQILEDEHTPMNAAMKRGQELEPIARAKVNETLQAAYEPQCMESSCRGWQIASLDGWSNDAPVKAIEIKCPGAKTHSIAKTGKIPEHYLAQLQHQMEVAELDSVAYCSYFEGEVVIVEIFRNDSYIKKLVQAETDFYDRLASFEPPECDERDYIQIVDPNAILAAQQLSEVSLQLKKLEELHDALRKDLIQMSGHKNVRIGDMKVTKIVRKGNIDYSSIPELKDVPLENYRKKPITSWRIS